MPSDENIFIFLLPGTGSLVPGSGGDTGGQGADPERIRLSRSRRQALSYRKLNSMVDFRDKKDMHVSV